MRQHRMQEYHCVVLKAWSNVDIACTSDDAKRNDKRNVHENKVQQDHG